MRRAFVVCVWTVVFALAYAQSPLYTSNQNQYFLHGLARAGVGFLRQDWLATTLDPTPVFSALVEGTVRALGAWAFYLEYALLMGVYLFSLADIVRSFAAVDGAPGRRMLLWAGLVALHSAALRFVLSRGLGTDWEFVLEGGVAGQRFLGQVLQPSSFGVGLVLALALFLRGRTRWAAAAAAAAATVHPTYLLTAGLLVAGFVWMEARANGWKRAMGTAALALILVAPITVYAARVFTASGADAYALASDILVRQRIPHHAIPAKWLDATVVAQAALLLLALLRARRTPLWALMAWLTAAAVGLTVLQMATGNMPLALLLPWRVTSLLVPVASGVLVATAVGWMTRAGVPRSLRLAAVAGLVLLEGIGVYRFTIEQRQQREDPATPVMAYVAGHLADGQVYLIPPKLQDFRLRTGAPIVVDAKAIPYRDVEVLEWFDRLRLARLVYRGRPEYIDCELFYVAMDEYAATRVVLEPAQLPLSCPQLRAVYDDGAFAVFDLQSSEVGYRGWTATAGP